MRGRTWSTPALSDLHFAGCSGAGIDGAGHWRRATTCSRCWHPYWAFLGSWLIHLAGLFTDTHELLRRHPQAVEHPDLTNALQDGTLTLGQIKLAIAACLLLTAPIAVCFLVVGGVPALVLGVVGVVASFGYSAGPRPYTTLGIAEPIFFAMFGTVAVAGTYYAQIAWLAAAASQPVPSLAALPAAASISSSGSAHWALLGDQHHSS